jgi:hypothetical protein
MDHYELRVSAGACRAEEPEARAASYCGEPRRASEISSSASRATEGVLEGRRRVHAVARSETHPATSCEFGDAIARGERDQATRPEHTRSRVADHYDINESAAHLLTAVLAGLEPLTRTSFLRALRHPPGSVALNRLAARPSGPGNWPTGWSGQPDHNSNWRMTARPFSITRRRCGRLSCHCRKDRPSSRRRSR